MRHPAQHRSRRARSRSHGPPLPGPRSHRRSLRYPRSRCHSDSEGRHPAWRNPAWRNPQRQDHRPARRPPTHLMFPTRLQAGHLHRAARNPHHSIAAYRSDATGLSLPGPCCGFHAPPWAAGLAVAHPGPIRPVEPRPWDPPLHQDALRRSGGPRSCRNARPRTDPPGRSAGAAAGSSRPRAESAPSAARPRTAGS